MRLVITGEPEGAWCQLEGDSAAEWDVLEAAAIKGERTSGPGVETMDRLRKLTTEWGVAVTVERR
jgi:hypothetical protein